MDQNAQDAMDDLLTQLDHSWRIIDGPSSAEPAFIEVPRGYSLQLVKCALVNTEELLVSCKKENRKRIEKGWGALTSRRQHLTPTFDPARLMRRHALTLPPWLSSDTSLLCSTLSNSIHPLFAIERFHGCSDQIYELLKPVLRLSTLLLCHRATGHFWLSLVLGRRVDHPEMSVKQGKVCRKICEDVPWTEDSLLRFQQCILDALPHLHFQFSYGTAEVENGAWDTYGTMSLIRDYRLGLTAPHGGQPYTSRIAFHPDFYTTLRRLSTLRNADPAMVLRFNFSMAIVICHEIAHFLEAAECHPHRTSKDIHGNEHYFRDLSFVEMGVAFETMVFGGRVEPISSRIDCSYGLVTFDYMRNGLKEEDRLIYYSVSMEYIAKIQQQSFWDAFDTEPWQTRFALGDKAALLIPRTGARSVFSPIVYPLIWEDEATASISEEVDGLDTTLTRTSLGGRIIKRNHFANPGEAGKNLPRKSGKAGKKKREKDTLKHKGHGYVAYKLRLMERERLRHSLNETRKEDDAESEDH